MADDDEIDILGDFNLDNFLSKSDSGIYENSSLVSQNSELLNCEYTIHPQWLLDKPSANPECWYDNNGSVSEKSGDYMVNDNDALGHVSTENAITDESGWTEKEKTLLEQGIEIFGKSNARLAQFIGSRTSAEVKYYLKNFYMEAQGSYSSFSGSMLGENNLVADILDDTQIPASIEEVIAAVSTAKPVISVKQSRKKSVSFNSTDEDDYIDKSLKGHLNALKYPQKKKFRKKVKKNVKFKMKTKLKFPMNRVKPKALQAIKEEKDTSAISVVQITTGKGLGVPICEGEEIVKISKHESDSDVEVDVEDSDETKLETTVNNDDVSQEVSEAKILNYSEKSQRSYIDLASLDQSIVAELTSMKLPHLEVQIPEGFVSEMEKVIHCEFFEGRPTKTPMRYLKIRNHIVHTWKSSKPSYVTKTSIRQGLKNCGDVHCISRIHCFLEQMGAINFNCSQTTYLRPLINVFQTMGPLPREKSMKKSLKSTAEFGFRSRTKRKFANDGEGGCTLTHDEKGEVINTTIVNEEPPKPKTPTKKPSIRLIYCRAFPEGTQKYKVRMNLTTLLLMDFHAHTSLSEVMGLVAGTWNPDKKILTISHYEACKNIASSTTHCDMCPISQSRAAELIHRKALNVLGWFHSHPTFAPEPSQQDLDTQQEMQKWMGVLTPCLGVILSPFSAHGALIASPFRCLVVDKKQNFEDQFVPYKFQVDVVSDHENAEQFLESLRKIVDFGGQIDFSKPYFQDNSLTYLEKYITSVRMHLAKCGVSSKMTCDFIVENIENICSN